MSIAALSLGLLFDPMTVTSKPSVVYAQTGLDSEYKTHGWFYTLEEMKKVYEKEYEEGKRLENYIGFKGGKYTAYYGGKSFELPEKFIRHTLSQLEQMLEKGYAKYIFKLDACHSHLIVPDRIFEKYIHLNYMDTIEAVVKEDGLGALYHNTEHLKTPSETETEAKKLFDNRSVLGWYDGRPLEIIHPKENDPEAIKEANTGSEPEGYRRIGFLVFKATKNGEFTIKPNGQEIRVDLSFDADAYWLLYNR